MIQQSKSVRNLRGQLKSFVCILRIIAHLTASVSGTQMQLLQVKTHKCGGKRFFSILTRERVEGQEKPTPVSLYLGKQSDHFLCVR
jgi:hypothetical protein